MQSSLPATEDIHLMFELVSAAAMVVTGYLGLLIKDKLHTIRESQLELRANLLDSQNRVKDELKESNDKIRRDLDVHTARDEEQFKTVNGKLDRIERKIDNGGSRQAHV